MGSRLGQNIPKSMVKLNNDFTILDLQLEILKKNVKLEDIILVVGYKKHLIIERYPELSYIYNPDYKNTNTSKSLLYCLKTIEGDHDVLWLNGDVVFEPSIFDLIMENIGNNIICVNNSKVTEEEVKYNLNAEGYIKEISKGLEDGQGEAVGINFIKKEYLPLFISCLENCNDDDYFEKGIEMVLEHDVEFFPVDIKNNFCVEVDFHEDLELARKFIKRGG